MLEFLTTDGLRRKGWLLLLALPLAGQTIDVRSEPLKAGETGKVVIAFVPAGKQALALEWEMDFSGTAMRSAAFDTGDAAKNAGKSVACRAIPVLTGKTQGAHYRCLVAGGTQPLGPGIVAEMKFTANRYVKPGHYPVRLRKIMAVDANSKNMGIKDAEGSVTLSKAN